MRRTAAVLALFLAIAASLSAVSKGDFDRVVDFSVTLKTLDAVADGKEALPGARMLLLSGTVSGITVLNKDEPTFKVRLELITGEWIGTEDVKAYACYVEYSGPEFYKVFPARAPAKAGSDVVVQNARVLVAARALSVITTPLGEKRVLLEGAYIRVIE